MLNLLYIEQNDWYKISEVIKSQGIDYKSNLTEIHNNVLGFKQLQKEKIPKLYKWQIVDSSDQELGKK